MTPKQFCESHGLTLDHFYGRVKYEGDLDLRSITEIPAGAKLDVSGYLDLGSLTSLPEGVSLTAGWSLYLGSLTSLPEGVSLTAGGYLDLSSLTSLPKGVSLTAGWSLYLGSLTSLPEGANLTAGRDLYLNLKPGSVSCPKPTLPISWQNGKYRLIDNILTEFLRSYKNYFRVRIVGKTAVSYCVTDGKHWAHGATLAEARTDLLFKSGSRNAEHYRDMPKDKKMSFAEAVGCYRLITGACAQGVKNFVESRGLSTKKKYSVNDMLKVAEGEYGYDNFKTFFGGKG